MVASHIVFQTGIYLRVPTIETDYIVMRYFIKICYEYLLGREFLYSLRLFKIVPVTLSQNQGLHFNLLPTIQPCVIYAKVEHEEVESGKQSTFNNI
jgi:hypothetical protein